MTNTAKTLKPATITESGKLKCGACKKADKPRLIEVGYSVTHRLLAINGKSIEAMGWDGDSSDISEQGDEIRLECSNCFAEYALPEGFEVEWL